MAKPSVDAQRPPSETERQRKMFADPSGPRGLGQVVDELGTLKAKIADLQVQEQTLRDELVAADVPECEGHYYRCTISRGYVEKIDWKTVADKLEPSHQLLTAHTTTSPRVTVKVVSR